MIDLHEVLDTPDKRTRVGNYFIRDHKDYDTGLSLFESALDLDPYNLVALCNGAYLLMKRKDLGRAEHWVKQALGKSPEHAHALATYALIAQESTEYDAARALFEHALRNDPHNLTVLLNYAYMLQLVGDYRAARDIYTKARDVAPLDLGVRFNRSMCMMTIAETPEEWREALDEYEIRHLLYNTRGPANKILYSADTVVEGDNPALVIVGEQGIGDQIMMGRYASFLKAQGKFKRIYLTCLEPWKEIMGRMIGFDGVFTTKEEMPPHEYYIQALSLLRSEGYPRVTAPNSPYVRGRSVIHGKTGKLKVGLCWAGSPEHDNDKYRSIGPDQFSDAFARLDGDVEFYSMQKPGMLKPEFVNDGDVSSLERLADVIQSMDLIVTVDTAVLHIAGALYVPTFAAIASNADWRWTQSGDKTHWYPSVRLFRAKRPLEWRPVLEEMGHQIERFARERTIW